MSQFNRNEFSQNLKGYLDVAFIKSNQTEQVKCEIRKFSAGIAKSIGDSIGYSQHHTTPTINFRFLNNTLQYTVDNINYITIETPVAVWGTIQGVLSNQTDLWAAINSHGGDKNFVFIQGVAASIWNISHNLNKYPSVSVVDSALSEVIGDIRYIDLNNITLTFSAPFSGEAFLN